MFGCEGNVCVPLDSSVPQSDPLWRCTGLLWVWTASANGSTQEEEGLRFHAGCETRRTKGGEDGL